MARRLSLLAVLLVLVCPGIGRAGEDYFLLMYGSQRIPNNPNYSHSFATFVRVRYNGPQPGVPVIYRAGETLEVLARNPLGEAVVATPAILDRKLYVRTAQHLFAFGTANATVTAVPEIVPTTLPSGSP